MSNVQFALCKVGNRFASGEGMQCLRGVPVGCEVVVSDDTVQPTASLVAPAADAVLHVWRVAVFGANDVVVGFGTPPANLAAALVAGLVVFAGTDIPLGVTEAGEQPWVINAVAA